MEHLKIDIEEDGEEYEIELWEHSEGMTLEASDDDAYVEILVPFKDMKKIQTFVNNVLEEVKKPDMYECPSCLYMVRHPGECPNCGRTLVKSPEE